MRLMLIAGLCLAAAACSRSDENQVRQDTRSAGRDLADAAHQVQTDPSVRRAGADARQAAHDAATALRKSAADAEVKGGQALIDAGVKTKRAAANAQGARTVDGLQVLVAQGALSLELWIGRAAPREIMARAARAQERMPD